MYIKNIEGGVRLLVAPSIIGKERQVGPLIVSIYHDVQECTLLLRTLIHLINNHDIVNIRLTRRRERLRAPEGVSQFDPTTTLSQQAQKYILSNKNIFNVELIQDLMSLEAWIQDSICTIQRKGTLPPIKITHLTSRVSKQGHTQSALAQWGDMVITPTELKVLYLRTHLNKTPLEVDEIVKRSGGFLQRCTQRNMHLIKNSRPGQRNNLNQLFALFADMDLPSNEIAQTVHYPDCQDEEKKMIPAFPTHPLIDEFERRVHLLHRYIHQRNQPVTNVYSSFGSE